MKTKSEYPSMDIVYEWGRASPEQLSREADAQDMKIIGVFSAASIVITVVAGLAGQITLGWTLVPFVIASVCFAILFGKSLWALRAYPFLVPDSPKVLREDWWPLAPEEAKLKYWESIENAFDANYKAVEAKGQVLRLIVPLLALEVISLLVWLFLL